MQYTPPIVAFLRSSVPRVALPKDPPWYAGISGGDSRTDRELVKNRESTIVNATNIQTDFNATGNAWKVFGGDRFNDMVCGEFNYADLGRHAMFTTMVALDGFNTASILVRRESKGYGADLLLSRPVAGPSRGARG